MTSTLMPIALPNHVHLEPGSLEEEALERIALPGWVAAGWPFEADDDGVDELAAGRGPEDVGDGRLVQAVSECVCLGPGVHDRRLPGASSLITRAAYVCDIRIGFSCEAGDLEDIDRLGEQTEIAVDQ